MLQAWFALFRRLYLYTLHHGRPATPELTSLEDAEMHQPRLTRKFTSIVRTNAIARSPSSKHRSVRTAFNPSDTGTELDILEKQLPLKHGTSETVFLSLSALVWLDSTTWKTGTSQDTSRAGTPVPQATAYQPTNVRLSQIQPISPLTGSYTPSRSAPLPPKHRSSECAVPPEIEKIDATRKSESSVRRTPSKVRGRISAPIPASFVHVEGAFLGGAGEEVDKGKGLGVRCVSV